MSTLPQQRPTQGVAPELSSRCAGCGAALAPDQLFCLSCGTRRRDARIAFRDVLASEAAPVYTAVDGSGGGGAVPPTMVQQLAPQGPGHTNYTPFIATLASLLLALGVGVWIGRGQEAPAATAAPVAVAPVAAAAPTTPADTAAPADDAAADDAAAADDSATDDAAADDSADSSGVATPDTKKLEDLSPDDYQKQSQKLPKEVGTGGTPPPKDDKPAGGGSEFESFE